MSGVASRQILLVGLHSTGKTTFLAALWWMVDQPAVPCGLTLESLDGDRKHLNAIRDSWLHYRPVIRTSSDSENLVSMRLKDQRGASVKLTFPDLSGESFRLQWAKRQLALEHDNLMRQANGGILFVHPEKIVKPSRTDVAQDLVSALDTTVVPPRSNQLSPQQAAPWDIEKAPTQVQLVELLQILASRDHFLALSPFRLAVIVSAFDLVEPTGLNPQQFVFRELPLLTQFLQSNESLFIAGFYGISAQGGPYMSPILHQSMIVDDKAMTKRLKEKSDPVSARIWDSFDGPTQTILRRTEGEDQGKLLAEKLNEQLSRDDFYKTELFTGIQLRVETIDLLRELERNRRLDFDFTGLNRRLLEDVYPSELSKMWAHQTEYEALQNRRPSHRVAVFGEGVQNRHDITEPIQWLML